MSDLIEDVAKGIEENENFDMAVSAISTQNEIGFPKRIFENDSREGEHGSFDEAYDYACKLLGQSDLNVEKEDQFVWFTKSE